MLQDVRAQLVIRNLLGVLGRNDDGVNAKGLAGLVILNRHLALAVGAQVGELAALANFAEPFGELVGERDGCRHQFRRLVGGEAEHHALVASAAGVHALRDVAGLAVDGGDDSAGVRIEAVEGVVVADGGNHAAHQRLEVHVRLGGDFAGNHYQSGRRQRLRSHAAVRVLFKTCVQNGIGNLVGNLVRMAFRHRFRGKQETVTQSQFLQYIGCRGSRFGLILKIPEAIAISCQRQWARRRP